MLDSDLFLVGYHMAANIFFQTNQDLQCNFHHFPQDVL